MADMLFGVHDFEESDFEKYIIFHRGVQNCYIDQNDGHMYVVYQDGYKQDLGNPLGDNVLKAQTAATQAEKMLVDIASAKNELQSIVATTEDLKEDIEQRASEAVQASAASIEAKETIDSTITDTLDNIDGIAKKTEEGYDKYYIDLSNYSDTSTVDTKIDTAVKNISGVSYDTETEKYYVNPLMENSITANVINNKIDEKILDVDGIEALGNNSGRYQVNFNGAVIDMSYIHRLFGRTEGS